MAGLQHPRLCSIICVSTVLLLILLSQALRDRRQEGRHRRDVLDSTEIPAEHIDPAAIDLTPLVNTLINNSQSGSRQLFSLLSVTSYSSLALHKLTLLLYNISSIRSLESNKFRRRFCYCVTNETNDLTDFTAILLDVMGNSTSYLHELFKSASILSVSQRNNSDCIYICVMAGKMGRDVPELWEVGSITPLFNQTIVEGPHRGNISSFRLPVAWNQLPTNLSHISPSGMSSMLTSRVHSTEHVSPTSMDEAAATTEKMTTAQPLAPAPQPATIIPQSQTTVETTLKVSTHAVMTAQTTATISQPMTTLQVTTVTKSASPTTVRAPSTTVGAPPTTSTTVGAPPTTSTTVGAPSTTVGAPPTTSTTVGAPSTTVGAPSTTVRAPSTPVGAPSTTVGAPSTTVRAPSTTVGAPSTTSTTVGAPSTTVGAPSTTVGAPSTTVGAPLTTVRAPPTTGRALSTTKGAPSTTSTTVGAPLTTVGAPSTTSTTVGAPLTTVGAPSTTSTTVGAPLTTVRAPSTTVRAPSTVSAPTTTVGAPSTTVRPPSTIRAPTTTVRAPSTTVRPPSTIRAPTTTVRAPSTTVGAPSTTVGAPSTTVGAPSTTVGAPSTIRAPSTTFRAPSTTVGGPLTTVRAPSTIRTPSTTFRAPSTTVGGPSTTVRAPSTIRAPSTTVGAPSTTVRAPSTASATQPAAASTKPTQFSPVISLTRLISTTHQPSTTSQHTTSTVHPTRLSAVRPTAGPTVARRTTGPLSRRTTTPSKPVATEKPGCPWRKPERTDVSLSGSTTTVGAHKLQPCVLELCKFFSQCLCRPSGHKTRMKRYCDDSHLWYVKHTSEVCRRVRRVSFSRNLKQRCLTKMCSKL
ncbi:uncharacterized protein LOC119498445 isoform X2 [Sebastes umbrosus]|uniref:uncharacterized protein LOC119498445 isoform X2 n=1 Tax=Sebastes umbrosus TaxID=72105 RepID=UPI00189FE817|nr:uncharacterized protein LOC119498445 isoform X2 [Sebastes umbrosus]